MLFIDDAACLYAAQTHGPNAQQWLDDQIAAAIASSATPPRLIIVRLSAAGTLAIEIH